MKCLCGCNQGVKPGNKHINGHNGYMNKGRKGQIPWNKGIKTGSQTIEHINKCSKTKIGHIVTKETRLKIGKANYKENGGIDIGHNHVRAWKSFGKDKCEICGISLEDYKNKHPRSRRFSMHCRDKNYNNFVENNWITVCEYSCHQKLDKLDRI